MVVVAAVSKMQLPALVKAGNREAAGRFVQAIDFLNSTTPALRASPPQLRRGLWPNVTFQSVFFRIFTAARSSNSVTTAE